MEGPLAVPFHFAVELLVLIVALGGALDALRARRHGAGVWSLAQAAGFIALAVAQGAHGSLIAQADGGPEILATRTIAFLLLAVARPATNIARSITASAAAPALFFPGPQASMAVAPALAALAAAVPGWRAHRRDQDPATFAYTAAFVCFAAAEFATASSPATGDGWVLAAHIGRALAALFLARWLYGSVARSLRLRFVAAFVVVLVVGILVVSTALNVVIGNTLQDEELKRLADSAHARAATISQTAEASASNTSLFAQSNADRFRERGSGQPLGCAPGRGARALDLTAIAAMRVLPPDADFILFVVPGPRTIGSAGARAGQASACVLPRDEEIAISGSRVVEEALNNRRASSPVAISVNMPDGGVRTQIVAMGADPVRDVSGRLVGAVAVGYRIDAGFLARIKQETNAEATLIVGDGAIAETTFEDRVGLARAVARERDDLRRAREAAADIRTILPLGNERYSTAFIPLTASNNRTIGVLMLATVTEALATAQREVTGTLFMITLLAVLLAAVLAWLSGGRVTKPVRALTAAVTELREGNLTARARVTGEDEVGTLGGAFNSMAEELQRTTSDLVEAAGTEATLRVRMEAILQSMGDGLLATDEHGNVATVNRAAERLIGVRADRLTGKKISEVLRGTAEGGRALHDAAIRGGSAEGILHGAQRRRIPVAITSAPLLDQRGTTVGRVVLLRDVSRVQEAERMKSEFLQNVSHELRTPITPIKGFAQIMRGREFPREKTEQFLEGILQSTERLERIVEILVDFAAIEAGRLKPESHPIEVRGMVEDMATRWRERFPKHKIVGKAEADLPPVIGDAKLLGRSFDELMDNAVKFSPDGGPIEILAAPYANGARRTRRVQITIRDHGIGIAPEAMTDLFQDFRQLDGSETRAYGGLGLGLAYVKRIASVHDGEILVESEPGKGSAFTLVLPAGSLRAQMERPVARTPARRIVPGSGPRTKAAATGAAATRKPAVKRSAAKTTKARPKATEAKPVRSASKPRPRRSR